MCLKPPKPRRWKSILAFLELQDVAPDGVYTDQICHHICGELLPRLFILTTSEQISKSINRINSINFISPLLFLFPTKLRFAGALNLDNIAVIFCCTFLRVSSTGRYPASFALMEPGLSSYATSRPCYTRPFFPYFNKGALQEIPVEPQMRKLFIVELA